MISTIKARSFMITEKELENYTKLNQKISDCAAKILETYKKIRDEVFAEKFPAYTSSSSSTDFRSVEFVSFSSIDGQYIVYSGDEFWSYGGHESHVLTLPLSYLTCENLSDVLRKEFNEKKEEFERQETLKNKLEEVKERALFDKLSEKYGS